MKTLLCALFFALGTPLTAAADLTSGAPLFVATLYDLNDKPVALERYRGQPLIVNFWARWCAPCRAEIPELAELRRTHQGKLEVLGIGIEDNAEAAREFAQAQRMSYPVFIAKAQGIPLMQALGNDKGGLPFTLAIDRHGQVIERRLGRMKKADLDALAERLLKAR